MKLNDTIMEETKLLLAYEAPVLRELSLGLAFGKKSLDKGGSIDEFTLGADGEEGEENETYSLDDY